MYFNKAISLACKMLASRRPFRVQVKPTTFPMMLSYNGNCLVSEKIRRETSSSPGPSSGGPNLVPRACDPWEGNEGSGIIRCRKPGIVAKIELRINFNGQSESSLKRIIPEPSFPSRGSQARGTRLGRPSQHPRSQGLSAARVLPRPWDTPNRNCKKTCTNF